MILAGLIDVIHWLEDVFERLQLRRSYGGAIAYNYYAPPRLTQDVDVLVLVPDIKVPGLLDEFSSERLNSVHQYDLRVCRLHFPALRRHA